MLSMKRKGERADILLVKGGRAILIEGAYPFPFEVAAPFAMGSGGVFAQALMKRDFSAKAAVELAIECDPYSGGEVRTYES